MPISLQLLLSDYERARAAGDAARASAILKQIEEVGLPDRLKSKPKTSRRGSSAGKQPRKGPTAGGQSGIKIDPGRF